MRRTRFAKISHRGLQFGAAILPGSIGCQRVVASHVRVDNLDFSLTHQARKLARAYCVKSITQRQHRNVVPQCGKLTQQRRVGPQGRVQLVSTGRKRIGEIGEVPFSTTDTLR